MKSIFDADEKLVIRISLICVILGLVLIFISTKIFEVGKVNLTEIDDAYLGKFISTKGIISEIRISNGNLFLNLENSDLNIVYFTYEGKRLEKNNYIEIIGDVQKYKGELEIIAKEIKKIS